MRQMIRSGYRMIVLSIVSFGVNLGFFLVALEVLSAPPEISAVIAAVLVMGMNFAACKYWIYDSRDGGVGRQLALFVVSTLVFRGIEIGVFSVIYRNSHIDEQLLYPMVLGVSFLVKFVFFGKTVFVRV